MLFGQTPAPVVPKYFRALLFFCLIIFFLEMADSIMAYVAPIFLENGVQNSFYMGIILSSSSVAGLLCDAIFPSIFRAKKHLFFLWNTVILALLFPAIFLFFPHAVPEFLIAMAIWGIYYEFLVFSKAYFIEAFIRMDRHAMAWGILNVFRSLTMVISPLAVPLLLDQGTSLPLMVTFALLVTSLVGIVIFNTFFPQKERPVANEIIVKKTSALKELIIWRHLFIRIWPIFLFTMALYVLEATFFSVGILASEELRQTSFFGSLLIPAYVVPSLFTGFFVQKLGSRIGKKRVAFVSAGVGGLLLFFSMFLTVIPLLLILVIFLSSIFTSISLPAILAVTQNYVSRLGEFGGEMVGLQNAAASVGYIVGPMLAGWAAMEFGNMQAVAGVGLLLLIIAIINLIFVPHKVHMPQRALHGLTEVIQPPPLA